MSMITTLDVCLVISDAVIERNSIEIALLRVISCVCEETWINTSLHTVGALDDITMLVGSHELVVQEKLPDSLHQLAFAVCENSLRCSVIVMFHVFILKSAWKLLKR